MIESKPPLGPFAPGGASACSRVEGRALRRLARFAIALTLAVVGGVIGLMSVAAAQTGAPSVAGSNYQGLWWAPNGDESSWGVNLTHKGDIDNFGSPIRELGISGGELR